MATKFVLDTHALIWHLEGSVRLGATAKSILQSPNSSLVLPIIALAEAAFVVERRRTIIPSVEALFGDIEKDPRIEIYPLNEEILTTSLSLTSIPEIHDRLIVATGVYLQKQGESVQILTKDNEIVLSSLLKIAW